MSMFTGVLLPGTATYLVYILAPAILVYLVLLLIIPTTTINTPVCCATVLLTVVLACCMYEVLHTLRTIPRTRWQLQQQVFVSGQSSVDGIIYTPPPATTHRVSRTLAVHVLIKSRRRSSKREPDVFTSPRMEKVRTVRGDINIKTKWCLHCRPEQSSAQ